MKKLTVLVLGAFLVVSALAFSGCAKKQAPKPAPKAPATVTAPAAPAAPAKAPAKKAAAKTTAAPKAPAAPKAKS